MNRSLSGTAVLIFTIGILAIYLGMGIMDAGNDVSNTGGAFGNEMAAIGGMWTSLGAVLTLLGILSFPAALGFLGLKEWGRKNGVVIVFLISALSIVAGFITIYFDFMSCIIYFILTVLALICGQLLREKKDLFELGSGTIKRTEPTPTYREVRHVKHNVIIRQSKESALRQGSDHGRIQHGPMVKCSRCGTMNDADRTHCKMCANKL